MSSRAESYCPHFYEQRIALPGTNIDPVTSPLGGCQQQLEKAVDIFYSPALIISKSRRKESFILFVEDTDTYMYNYQ